MSKSKTALDKITYISVGDDFGFDMANIIEIIIEIIIKNNLIGE